MKHFMWLLKWVLKAAIFFTLFAFALNNQQDTTVHFFFGTSWRAPLVLVVLTTFTAGVFVGVLGMVPRWWKQRRVAAGQSSTAPTANADNATTSAPTALPPSLHGL